MNIRYFYQVLYIYTLLILGLGAHLTFASTPTSTSTSTPTSTSTSTSTDANPRWIQIGNQCKEGCGHSIIQELYGCVVDSDNGEDTQIVDDELCESTNPSPPSIVDTTTPCISTTTCTGDWKCTIDGEDINCPMEDDPTDQPDSDGNTFYEKSFTCFDGDKKATPCSIGTKSSRQATCSSRNSNDTNTPLCRDDIILSRNKICYTNTGCKSIDNSCRFSISQPSKVVTKSCPDLPDFPNTDNVDPAVFGIVIDYEDCARHGVMEYLSCTVSGPDNTTKTYKISPKIDGSNENIDDSSIRNSLLFQKYCEPSADTLQYSIRENHTIVITTKDIPCRRDFITYIEETLCPPGCDFTYKVLSRYCIPNKTENLRLDMKFCTSITSKPGREPTQMKCNTYSTCKWQLKIPCEERCRIREEINSEIIPVGILTDPDEIFKNVECISDSGVDISPSCYVPFSGGPLLPDTITCDTISNTLCNNSINEWVIDKEQCNAHCNNDGLYPHDCISSKYYLPYEQDTLGGTLISVDTIVKNPEKVCTEVRPDTSDLSCIVKEEDVKICANDRECIIEPPTIFVPISTEYICDCDYINTGYFNPYCSDKVTFRKLLMLDVLNHDIILPGALRTSKTNILLQTKTTKPKPGSSGSIDQDDHRLDRSAEELKQHYYYYFTPADVEDTSGSGDIQEQLQSQLPIPKIEKFLFTRPTFLEIYTAEYKAGTYTYLVRFVSNLPTYNDSISDPDSDSDSDSGSTYTFTPFVINIDTVESITSSIISPGFVKSTSSPSLLSLPSSPSPTAQSCDTLVCINDGIPNEECTSCAECRSGFTGTYCDCKESNILFVVRATTLLTTTQSETLGLSLESYIMSTIRLLGINLPTIQITLSPASFSKDNIQYYNINLRIIADCSSNTVIGEYTERDDGIQNRMKNIITNILVNILSKKSLLRSSDVFTIYPFVSKFKVGVIDHLCEGGITSCYPEAAINGGIANENQSGSDDDDDDDDGEGSEGDGSSDGTTDSTSSSVTFTPSPFLLSLLFIISSSICCLDFFF